MLVCFDFVYAKPPLESVSRQMPIVPRIGEGLHYLNRFFRVSDVRWQGGTHAEWTATVRLTETL